MGGASEKVLATLPSGSSFKFTRVLINRNFEVGVTIYPIVIFDGTSTNLGEVNASSLLSNSFDTTNLKLKGASVCG
jgi:hypothetical protein